MSWQEYNDAASKAIFQLFKKAIEPAVAAASPDWLLHHIELRRRPQPQGDGFEDQVEIRLIMRPLGSTRIVENPMPLDRPGLNEINDLQLPSGQLYGKATGS